MNQERSAREFLSTDVGPELANPADQEQPPNIHGYQFIKLIGRGGMGSVWLADEQKEVKRRVAIKVIKTATQDERIIDRFHAERQAIASMKHPNIANFFGGGETEDGTPYFVMEYVDGIPITEHCNQHQLSVDDRLRLFALTCNAVQHAHQKAIIHRDIKPSNILITEVDGQFTPKVIDFGLAIPDASNDPNGAQSLVRDNSHFAGSVMYASPEQAGELAEEIDTRSDVYSLGVVLYELITGTTPVLSDEIANETLLDALKIVRETDSPKPSERLSNSPAQLKLAAESAGISSAKLSQMCRDELDWIVNKAIEKEPEKRYQTAKELANDTERFLNNDVVSSHPQSMGYRTRKFVKRNRVLTYSIGIIAALLVVSLATISWIALEREAARKDAVAQQITAENLRKQSNIDLIRTNSERARWQPTLDLADQYIEDWKEETPELTLLRIKALNGLERIIETMDLVEELEASPELTRQQRAQLMLWKGDLLLSSSQRGKEAVGLIEESIEMGLDENDERYAQAVLYVFRDKQIPKSSQILKELISDDPFNERATVLLVQNLFLTGKYDEARREIELAEKAFGSAEPRLSVARAWMLLAEGKTEEAEPILDQLGKVMSEQEIETLRLSGEGLFLINQGILQHLNFNPVSYSIKLKNSGYMETMQARSLDRDFSLITSCTSHPALQALLEFQVWLNSNFFEFDVKKKGLGMRAKAKECYEIYPDGFFQYVIGCTYLVREIEEFDKATEAFKKGHANISIFTSVPRQSRLNLPMSELGVYVEGGQKDDVLAQQALDRVEEIYADQVDPGSRNRDYVTVSKALRRNELARKCIDHELKKNPQDLSMLNTLAEVEKNDQNFGTAADIYFQIRSILKDRKGNGWSPEDEGRWRQNEIRLARCRDRLFPRWEAGDSSEESSDN